MGASEPNTTTPDPQGEGVGGGEGGLKSKRGKKALGKYKPQQKVERKKCVGSAFYAARLSLFRCAPPAFSFLRLCRLSLLRVRRFWLLRLLSTAIAKRGLACLGFIRFRAPLRVGPLIVDDTHRVYPAPPRRAPRGPINPFAGCAAGHLRRRLRRSVSSSCCCRRGCGWFRCFGCYVCVSWVCLLPPSFAACAACVVNLFLALSGFRGGNLREVKALRKV